MNTSVSLQKNFRGGTTVRLAEPPANPRRKELLIVYMRDLYSEAVKRLGRYFDVVLIEEKNHREN